MSGSLVGIMQRVRESREGFEWEVERQRAKVKRRFGADEVEIEGWARRSG